MQNNTCKYTKYTSDWGDKKIRVNIHKILQYIVYLQEL
jgi:hypothetical protein